MPIDFSRRMDLLVSRPPGSARGVYQQRPLASCQWRSQNRDPGLAKAMALSSRSVRESCHSPELERMRLNSVCACELAWRRGRFIHFAKNPRLWPVLGGHWPATEQMISSCRWRMARRFVDAPRRLVACNYSEWERWDGLETGRAKKMRGLEFYWESCGFILLDLCYSVVGKARIGLLFG